MIEHYAKYFKLHYNEDFRRKQRVSLWTSTKQNKRAACFADPINIFRFPVLISILMKNGTMDTNGVVFSTQTVSSFYFS